MFDFCKKYAIFKTVIFISFTFIGCEQTAIPVDSPSSYAARTLFSPTSPFNTKIANLSKIDPNSKVMVQSLVSEYKDKGFFIALKSYCETVYFVDSTSPTYDITLTASWAPKRTLLNVPIPDYAIPDPSVDGSMVIIDTVNKCEYDFWQMRKVFGLWYASWGNALSIEGTGIFEKGLSARGSGFALSAGIIWPHELQKKLINHALVFSYDHTKSGGPVTPATESDGTSSDASAIPEGALIQLNPDLDLNTLGLTEYEHTIARALQEYGMYLCDDGGGLELEAVNPLSFSVNVYNGLLPDEEYVSLDHIPIAEFRILELPAQDADSEPQIVQNACATFK